MTEKYSKWLLDTFYASLEYEPDTFGVESNRFTNSATSRSIRKKRNVNMINIIHLLYSYAAHDDDYYDDGSVDDDYFDVDCSDEC